MPNFITKRWHGYHMVFAMMFSLVLIVLLSAYNWPYALLGLAVFFGLGYGLYQAERSFREDFTSYVLTLSKRVKGANQTALDRMPLGILLYDRKGRVEWHNPFIKEVTGKDSLVGLPVTEVFPDLVEVDDSPGKLQIGERWFEVLHHSEERLYFFRDISRLEKLERQYDREQSVIGYLHLDNYDEAGTGLDEQERTQLLTDVQGAITRWAKENDINLRQFDSDKFFMVFRRESLDRIVHNRFDILDVVRDLTRENKIPITLSIGVAAVRSSMVEQNQTAEAALDIALARGGDQAAVQDGERMVFFGGKTSAVEKRTRVRARVISFALANLIKDSDHVLIMGHEDPDMDALGSAIGMLRFVRMGGRKGHIVLKDSNPSIDGLMEVIAGNESLEEAFIPPDRALQMVNRDSLLILVDTHKPSMALEPRLLEKSDRVVVIDHHRRGEEFVKDPVLVYLEPYASSTSELVTELLQYQGDRMTIENMETTALMAGIVVDTKSFAFRSGSRTFEAASFLRRHGADLAMVQTLLKEDLDLFVKRAEIVKNTEVVYDRIAISVGEEDERYHQLVIAQAADTLLGMKGVSASFVIGLRDDGKVAISARSQGEINVQLVMESLGGGGHLTNAAVQFEGMTLEEARQKLLDVLKENFEEGGDME
ncbi:MAG: DHH family phosphoesterase [Firmicutes bacterium]|uniref:Cyclic-di-AMP phosphodiesterase n=1 Tax=Melghirimyces thermohalophilus TaxID=1236220 RepID=A0A1G6M595_9BACL|nr:DHH family phosphoesterase [Melghirimyces thermohalophilus]MDA8351986.1 DHH family phosphoesterase [Bacillota bacterium]SDC50669.1 c-di-AMP phosphodiesterase, consists of a GGDEF-like and DHH domains [Melghirimyces thermohalophilus]